MVRPAAFGPNPSTAADNLFQEELKEDEDSVQEAALKEFTAFVDKLESIGIEVTEISDSLSPRTPDSVFPNNWICFRPDGVILFPMYSLVRRSERKLLDAVESMLSLAGKKIDFEDPLLDLREEEKDERFLEGTGSLVFDHINRVVYASLSKRTNKELCEEVATKLEYKLVTFNAVFEEKPVYHTNVILSVGVGFAIVALDLIENNLERNLVEVSLKSSNLEIISITSEQVKDFCGNVLEIMNKDGQKYLLCSQKALSSFTDSQKMQILNFVDDFLPVELSVIEKYGGGSARCCVAEVF